MRTTGISRRRFVGATAAGALGLGLAPGRAGTLEEGLLVIDTHTHFYDPTRPQGVPWPNKATKLYRQVLPSDYRAMKQPLPVAGTIVVEASEWLEDNQWILDLAAREPFIRGFVGNLNPGDEDFLKQLERFARNPVFRGIRVRVTKSLHEGLEQPQFLAGLKRLAALGLTLDIGGGGSVLAEVPRLAQLVPELPLVVNHLDGVRVDGQAPDGKWMGLLKEAARHPRVFCKISGLVEGTRLKDGTAPREPGFYRPTLDAVWEILGEDRLVYGSNWPVSELYAECGRVQGIVLDYFRGKGRGALEKVFAKNAQAAYRV